MQNDQFLVVWTWYNSSDSENDILAKVVSLNKTETEPQYLIRRHSDKDLLAIGIAYLEDH